MYSMYTILEIQAMSSLSFSSDLSRSSDLFQQQHPESHGTQGNTNRNKRNSLSYRGNQNFTQQNLPIDSCSTVKGAIIINPRLNSHLIHLIGNLTLATMHFSDNYALSALCKDRGRSICYYYTTKPAC